MPEAELPSLLAQAAGFLRSAAAVVVSGIDLVPEAQKAARLATCQGCEFYRPSDQRCGGVEGCGCWTPLKAAFAAARCPRGFWPDR